MVPVPMIIGAVSGSVGTLNTVKGWFCELRQTLEKVRRSGETLRQLESGIADRQTELGIWMEFWGLKELTSSRYQKELWGSDCLMTLSNKMVVINHNIARISEDVYSIMAKSRLKESALQGLQDVTNINAKSSQVAQARSEMKDAQNQLSIQEILSFVNNKGPELLDRHLTVKESLAELRKFSVDCFAAKHGVSLSNTLTEDQKNTRKTSVLLDMAMEMREASTGLYQSYHEKYKADTKASALPTDCIRLDLGVAGDNDLSLRNAQAMGDITLRYHLLVPWRSPEKNTLEFLVLGPLKRCASAANSQHDRGFLEACYAAENDEIAEFNIQYLTELRRFQSKMPEDANCFALSDATNSWTVLRTLIYREHSQFYLSQRISLAHRLVQCGLLISGTAWLSKIGNRVIKQTKDRGDSYHYVLELPTETEPLGVEYFRAATSHVFDIGILLLELGLGEIVRTIYYGPPSTNMDPNISTSSLTGMNYSRSATQWQEELRKHMGDEYTRAVTHCLAKHKERYWDDICDKNMEVAERKSAYKLILKDYYTKVHEPMFDLFRRTQRPAMTALERSEI